MTAIEGPRLSGRGRQPVIPLGLHLADMEHVDRAPRKVGPAEFNAKHGIDAGAKFDDDIPF